MRNIDRLQGDAALLIAGSSTGNELYTSTDKGATWHAVPPFFPGGMGFDGIFQDGSRLWLSASASYYSDDGGKVWHSSGAGTGGPSAFAKQAGLLWIFGRYTALAASADGGATWSTRDVPIPELLAPLAPSGVVAVDGVLFTSGTESTIDIPAGVFMSSDTGKTWVPRDKGLPLFPNTPKDSAMAGASAVFAMGKVLLARTHKGIYRSEDLGANWQAANTGISAAALQNADLESFFLGAGRPYRRTVVNDRFVWYTSEDSARTWRTFDPGVPDLESLAFTASTVLAFRRKGDSTVSDPIYQSKDGMKSWSPLQGPWASSATNKPDAMHVSGTHIYLTGYPYLGIATKYWHSPDEGATWESDSVQIYGEKLRWHAEMGTTRFQNDDYTLTVSTDSGRTWKRSLNAAGLVDESAILDQTLVVRIGAALFVSSDAGQTWKTPSVGDGSLSVGRITAFAGRFVAATPVGLRASRNGLDWTDAGETGLAFRYARAIVLSGNTMMAATNKGLFVSKDLGAHWEPSVVPTGIPPTPEPRVAWLAAGKKSFFAGTPNQGILISSDTGKTWYRQYSSFLLGMWAGPDNLVFDNGGATILQAPDLSPGAKTWADVPTKLFDNTELAMADGGLYLSKTEGAFVSETPGASWSPVKLPGQAPHDFLAGDGKLLAASSSDSLYVRSAADAEWQSIVSGLPKDDLSALSMDHGRLFAGLISQGLWINSVLPLPIAPMSTGRLLVARPAITHGADGSLVFRVKLSEPARLRLSMHSASGRILTDLTVSARPGIRDLRTETRGLGISFYRLEVEPETGGAPRQIFRGSLAPFH